MRASLPYLTHPFGAPGSGAPGDAARRAAPAAGGDMREVAGAAPAFPAYAREAYHEEAVRCGRRGVGKGKSFRAGSCHGGGAGRARIHHDLAAQIRCGEQNEQEAERSENVSCLPAYGVHL